MGLAFAVAASANLPVIVLSLFWRRFNTGGAVCGLALGLAGSIVLIALSPSVMGTGPDALIHHEPLFLLKNLGILEHSAGIPRRCCTVIRCAVSPGAEAAFAELSVRANTGIGAERASP